MISMAHKVLTIYMCLWQSLHNRSCYIIHQRHDEIRDTIENLTKEVCNDVEVEPHLIKLTGEKFAKSTNVIPAFD